MKKIYTVKAIKAMSDGQLIKAGIVNGVDSKALALETVTRCDKTGDTITVYLQTVIRTLYKAGENHVLNGGYQSWRNTEYNDVYRWVNTVQARARQLQTAAKGTGKKTTDKKTTGKKTTPTEQKAVAVGKEKMKTAAQKKRADSWSDKCKTARVALKEVQAGKKTDLKVIANLTATIKKLEQDNQRLRRESNGNKEGYQKLVDRIKAASTLEQFQAII